MKRTHLNNERFITEFSNMDYRQEISSKPRGVWYEVNNDWKDWCVHEMPRWIRERFNHEHHLEIDMTNVLVLRSKEDMYKFTKRFMGPRPYDVWRESNYIDWEPVAEYYDGIEIPEYLMECRMDENTNWYYSWDVASGCIWNTEIIKVVKSNPTAAHWHDLAEYNESLWNGGR